ncbi:MAG TPA: RIP metalloprotease RseP [Candidatus Faecivivens stercoripullorum]|uniref:Zinc metalloprotease n=1 Tax=Candidatus Faecivivens stercoripullorum TaxID=2840805 RepID=A0A9D1KR35_9FIRM|nr:RIP metalloprotease RseP [Candidatus Faecivivens stercoripullorum]
MKSILLTLLIFAAIIIIHECGHFFAARLCGVRVNEFAIGMGPTLLRFGKKETRYSLRLFPIGGFVAMEGESDQSNDPRAFCNQAVWKRMIIVCAGAVMNLVLGFVIILALTIPNKTLASTTIAEFSEGASTEASGLMVGDEITHINGRRMWVDSDIIFALSTDEDGVVDMTVRRDGEKVSLENVVFTKENGTLVIDFKVVGKQRGLINTLGYSLGKTASIGRLIWISIGQLVTGQAAISDLSGPIGTAQAVGEATKAGTSTVMNLFAFITVNVGIFNILPIPALDGGRLVFLLFEAVTRRRIKPEYEAYVHFAGFVLVILLFVFVSYQDIVNLIRG